MMTLVLIALGTSTPTELLPGTGARILNAFGLERGGDVVVQRGDLFQLHAGRRMKFVPRDGRPFGDVAQRDLDIELRQRLLHQPRIGHQLFFRFGRL